MQEIKNTTEENENNKRLLTQFWNLIGDTFNLLRETLKFNDEHINHQEVRSNILKDIPKSDIIRDSNYI